MNLSDDLLAAERIFGAELDRVIRDDHADTLHTHEPDFLSFGRLEDTDYHGGHFVAAPPRMTQAKSVWAAEFTMARIGDELTGADLIQWTVVCSFELISRRPSLHMQPFRLCS